MTFPSRLWVRNVAVIDSQFMYLTCIHRRRYEPILHCQLHLRMRSCVFTPLDGDEEFLYRIRTASARGLFEARTVAAGIDGQPSDTSGAFCELSNVGCLGELVASPYPFSSTVLPFDIFMVDPLSVFGAVGTAIDLGAKVYKYITSVVGQNDEQRQLAASVEALNAVLHVLKQRIADAERGPAHERSAYQKAMVVLGKADGQLALCEEALKEITEQIEKANPGLKEKYEAEKKGSFPSMAQAVPLTSSVQLPPRTHSFRGFLSNVLSKKKSEKLDQAPSPNQAASPSSLWIQTAPWRLAWPVTELNIKDLRNHISDFKGTATLILQLGFTEYAPFSSHIQLLIHVE